jgi:NitT/TauT family transport system ATP-binding protein
VAAERAVPRIVVEGLDLRYGDVRAAAGLSFDVRAGELVSLIGPSGCGKSSALRAIGGLLRPAGGSVRVDGAEVTGPLPESIAYVFQDLALFPWRSARRNVEAPLELRGMSRPQRRARALELLELVGLADSADRVPAELSGGMRQRVAIARALAGDADILLLDEPFAALDEQTRLKLGAELVRLLSERGKTVVFVTHSLPEAAYLADRIVVLTGRPATVKDVIEVPLPRPRVAGMVRTPSFHDLQDRLAALLLES